jgi:hypothetical protein
MSTFVGRRPAHGKSDDEREDSSVRPIIRTRRDSGFAVALKHATALRGSADATSKDAGYPL